MFVSHFLCSIPHNLPGTPRILHVLRIMFVDRTCLRPKEKKGLKKLFSGHMLDHIQKHNPILWVIDEAHYCLEAGESFRNQWTKLKAIRSSTSVVPIYVATATATATDQNTLVEMLDLRVPVVLKTSVARQEVSLTITPAKGKFHVATAHDIIKPEPWDQLTGFLKRAVAKGQQWLVHVGGHKCCNYISRRLTAEGIPAGKAHGAHPTDNREALADFRAGVTRVLVCTMVLECGYHMIGIYGILFLSPPRSLHALQQFLGRLAQGGPKGTTGEVVIYSGPRPMQIFSHH